MFNFFSSILDTLQILISYAVNLVTGLVNVVLAMVKGVGYLTATLALLPAPIFGVAGTIVAVAVVYNLLNKE